MVLTSTSMEEMAGLSKVLVEISPSAKETSGFKASVQD